MKKSPTTARTASWQYDSMDLAAGMDNKDHPSYKALSKFSGNQHGGAAEGNFGRGPTVGNQDIEKDRDSEGRRPPTAKLVDAWKSGSKSLYAGTYSGADQVRTPGGVKEFPRRGKESFDFGRGPTKGNKQ